MSQPGRKWLTVSITLIAFGVFGAVAAVYALNKMKGDAEVLGDIDRHFEAYENQIDTPPTPKPRSAPTSSRAEAPPPSASIQSKATKRPRRHGRRGRRQSSSSSPNNSETLVPGSQWKTIRRVGPMTYEIDSTLAKAARQTPQRFIPGVKAVIAERNGAPAGFRLLGVRPGGALFTLGLRNGDVLTAVNGFSLKSVDEALLAAGAAKLAERFRIDILRGDVNRSLYYRISRFSSSSPGP